MKRSILNSLVGIMLTFLIFPIPVNAQNDKQSEKYNPEEARSTIEEFKEEDPELTRFFESSYGYAVFPSIGKGGLGVGGAAGKGVVFKEGIPVGGSNMTQVTVGFQFGGQAYSEIIFFEDEETFSNFINNKFQFAAQASAVALKSGASADAKYAEGVAVFTMAKGGLMYEASVGGQKFKYIPFEE
jgi:lipid-binding SYLF domain-containing protein